MSGEHPFNPENLQSKPDGGAPNQPVEQSPKNPGGFMRKIGENKWARSLILAAGMAVGAESVACSPGDRGCADKKTTVEVKTESKWKKILDEYTTHDFYDANPEFLKPVPGGEYTEEQREERKKILPGGIEIFQDAWLDFYHVKKGDNLGTIIKKLDDHYEHLSTQKKKLESFNIKSTKIREGMWLPIPLENEERALTDEQFFRYAYLAIEDIKKDPHYGGYIKHMIQKVGQEEIMATLLAAAKQESGGKPLGQFEMHRYEPSHHAFSFSLFHVMNEGPGLKARHRLNMTEGQTYHPLNGCRLFLAFMIEKSGEKYGDVNEKKNVDKVVERLDNMLPVTAHSVGFAEFYNGSNWRIRNPNYPTNILRFRAGGMDTLRNMLEESAVEVNDVKTASGESVSKEVVGSVKGAQKGIKVAEKKSLPEKKEAVSVEGTAEVKIGTMNLHQAVRDSNYLYGKQHGKSPCVDNRCLASFSKRIKKYLHDVYRNNRYLPDDVVTMGVDEKGPMLMFERAGKKVTLRIK